MRTRIKNEKYVVAIFLTILITFCGQNLADAENPENRAPVFTDGSSATRAIAENTASGQNIGSAVAATDADNDRLIYTLSGTDAAAFSINRTTGQLQTNAALDYETKSSYSVTVAVSDRNGGRDSIPVTITVTDVNENRAPVFADGDSTTRSIAENTVAGESIGSAVAATDADNDTLTYSLGGTDAASFSIGSTTGQLQTSVSLDYETKTSYSVTVSVSDGNGGSDSIDVTINVTDVNETITPVNQRTQQVQDAIVAAIEGVDSADDVTAAHLAAITTLILRDKSITSLKAGDFDGLTALTTLYLYNNSISDISALEDLTELTGLYLLGNPILDYGPLRRLKTANPNVDIDINLNNNLPVFSDGDSATRAVAENTATGTNIGTAVAATDADGHTITYSLGGTDAESFDIVSTSGQLQTKDPLDRGTKTSYTVTVTAYDGNSGGDRITVTINITNQGGNAPSVETSPAIPASTELLTNFPNPFNPETWIPYQLAKPAEVTLTLYDIRGAVVRRLKLGHQAAGFYQSRSRAIHWDGRNNIGEKVASGVYFYTLTAGEFTATRKLLIRK